MVGRVDEAHADDEKYVYLIGADKLSSELHEISEQANKNYTNIPKKTTKGLLHLLEKFNLNL